MEAPGKISSIFWQQSIAASGTMRTISRNQNWASTAAIKESDRQLKFKDKVTILRNLRWPMREIQKAGPTWQLPAHPAGSEKSDTVILALPQERTDAIMRYAEKHHSSVNLVLNAAFFRALESVVPHPPNALLPIIMTVDLRRYLPSKKTDIMCNHSGAEVLFVHSAPNLPFEEILSQLLEQYRMLKKNYMGLSSILLILETFPVIKAVRFLPFHFIKKAFASRANPLSGVSSAAGLTNWGEIDAEKGRFGNTEINKCLCRHPPVSRSGGHWSSGKLFQENLDL